jgi:hypothetical protein
MNQMDQSHSTQIFHGGFPRFSVAFPTLRHRFFLTPADSIPGVDLRLSQAQWLQDFQASIAEAGEVVAVIVI